MKFTLSEIKIKLQGINNGMDEAKIQTNHLEHKDEKNIQSEQQKQKRIQKMRVSYGISGTISNIPTFTS